MILRFIEHIVGVFLLVIDVVAFGSFVCIIVTISVWDLRLFVVVSLPSRIPLLRLFRCLLLLFVLLDLVLVHFNIIASILRRNIRISRLLSSMVESCFLLNRLFLLFELLLGLIIEINLGLLYLSLLLGSVGNEGILLGGVAIVVFNFPSNLHMIDALKVLLDRLFAVFGVESILNFCALKLHLWSCLDRTLVFNLDLFLSRIIWLQLHESISVWFQMSDHMLLEQEIISSC